MTSEQKSLSRRFIIYKFFINLWLVEAVWLYFYRLFMSDAGAGLVDSLSFGIGLLAEIPSGALADRFGRARLMKIGIVLAGLGSSLQAIGGFAPILVLNSIQMIGFALISGADEALFFDKLKFKAGSLHWRKLMSRAAMATYAACTVAIPVGAVLYNFIPRVVIASSGIAILLSLIFVWRLRDEKVMSVKSSTGLGLAGYFSDIKTGLKTFLHTKLKIYVPLILTLQGGLYIFNWGLLKLILMSRFAISESLGGILLGVFCAINVLILWLMHRFAHKLPEKRVLTFLNFGVVAALVMSLFPQAGIWLGALVVFILYAGDSVLYPFLSEILHAHAPPGNRATVISVASFLKALPYIALAPLIGWLNQIGRLDVFLLAWAGLTVAAWAYYFVKKKHDEPVRVDFDIR